MMTLIEMNNLTLDLEVAQGENADELLKNRMIISHELFSELRQSSVFHDWLDTMNLKIVKGAQK